MAPKRSRATRRPPAIKSSSYTKPRDSARDLRRRGHLKSDEKIIDWCDGNFVAFYENGGLSTERPKTWLPWTKPGLIAVYTDRWILLAGRRFRRTYALPAVFRAEVFEGRVRILFSSGVGKRPALIELLPVGGPYGNDAKRFVTDLIYRRDIATAGIPDLEEHIRGIQVIRSIPSSDLINQLVLASGR